MKKRIIWLIDRLGYGGAEQVTVSLIKHFNKEQFDIQVCAFRSTTGSDQLVQELEGIGIPITVLPVRHLRDIFGLFRIKRYLKETRADLVHTQLELADTLGNVAAKMLKLPSVATLHTIELKPIRSRSFWRHQLWWFVLRNFCDRAITVSEKTRLHYIQHGKLQPDKVLTMYNGIDLSGFQSIDQEVINQKRQNLRLPDCKKIITTVAVLREQKGLQYMLAALPVILEQQPDSHYLIVGDGHYGDTLKAIVHERGLEEHVTFAGHHTDVSDLLALSDLFVLPTLGDALPTVLMEALAAGKPIVACEVGGVPEIVQHEVNGLLVPPENPAQLAHACLRLLQDDEFAQKMVANGLQIVKQRFDVDKQVQNLTELYQNLLA